jgi:hypothetical protein
MWRPDRLAPPCLSGADPQAAHCLAPPGSRAYLMKNALHDWDDRQACEILVNCRRVVPADGALLLVEWGLSDANLPSTGKLTDLVMLVQTGGKERTTCRGLPAQGGPAR